MKSISFSLLFATLTLLFVTTINCDDASDKEDMIKSLAESCIEKVKPSEDDIKRMVKMDLPTTKEGKCLSACLMEQFQIVRIKRRCHQSFCVCVFF